MEVDGSDEFPLIPIGWFFGEPFCVNFFWGLPKSGCNHLRLVVYLSKRFIRYICTWHFCELQVAILGPGEILWFELKGLYKWPSTFEDIVWSRIESPSILYTYIIIHIIHLSFFYTRHSRWSRDEILRMEEVRLRPQHFIPLFARGPTRWATTSYR